MAHHGFKINRDLSIPTSRKMSFLPIPKLLVLLMISKEPKDSSRLKLSGKI